MLHFINLAVSRNLWYTDRYTYRRTDTDSVFYLRIINYLFLNPLKAFQYQYLSISGLGSAANFTSMYAAASGGLGVPPHSSVGVGGGMGGNVSSGIDC